MSEPLSCRSKHGGGGDGGDGDDDRDNDDRPPLKCQLCARHCANRITHIHVNFMPKQVGTVNVVFTTF